jgi:hypothetical protein
MTEAEWLDCTDPEAMLAFPRGKTSDRKLRLFAVACCRRVLLPGDGHHHELDLAEEIAEAKDCSELEERREHWMRMLLEDGGPIDWAIYQTLSPDLADEGLPADFPSSVAELHLREILPWLPAQATKEDELALHADYLRCILGNPARHPAKHSFWLTTKVVALAQAIYDERAFDRMPILADALEDAGCDNASILNHCLQPGVHVRGCWVVDLVLGKE